MIGKVTRTLQSDKWKYSAAERRSEKMFGWDSLAPSGVLCRIWRVHFYSLPGTFAQIHNMCQLTWQYIFFWLRSDRVPSELTSLLFLFFLLCILIWVFMSPPLHSGPIDLVCVKSGSPRPAVRYLWVSHAHHSLALTRINTRSARRNYSTSKGSACIDFSITRKALMEGPSWDQLLYTGLLLMILLVSAFI